MSFNIKATFEEVRTLPHGSIGVAYMGIGTMFDKPIRHIVISNFTDVALMFSFNGINNHFPLPSNSFLSLDATKNNALEKNFFIGKGQRIYVKGAPTLGSVYVAAVKDKEL